MNRERDAGREYAEIWGETVAANRKLRILAMILAGACLMLAILLLGCRDRRSAPPLVVRVDDVGRAEAVAYENVRIEQAIRDRDRRVLEEYGDLRACLKRIVELKDIKRISSSRATIDGSTTWRLRRLPGGGF